MKLFIQLFTLLIYLNLIFYFSHIHLLVFPSYFIYVVLMIFMILYYGYSGEKIVLSKSLFIWIIMYLILYTIYFILSGSASEQFVFYKTVLMTLFSFISMSLLYNLDDENLLITRKTIVLALLIGTLLLLYHFTHPEAFLMPNEVSSGRAVATFGNANLAGALFIVGLILTIDIIPEKLKILYVLILFSGVLTTISRSNIIVYIIILFLLAYEKKLSRISVVFIFLFVLSSLFWLYFFGLDFLSSHFDITFKSDVTDRLGFFVSGQNVESHNEEREKVLLAALNMFMDHPLFGNGIGATRLWEYRVGPHNTFAATWAEFGLMGLLIIPSFLFFSTYDVIFNKNKKYRSMGILFIIYFTLSSFFSHNMLEVTFNICSATIIATLGYKNKNIIKA